MGQKKYVKDNSKEYSKVSKKYQLTDPRVVTSVILYWSKEQKPAQIQGKGNTDSTS